MNRESLYFALVNKELQRLHALLTFEEAGNSYGGWSSKTVVTDDVRKWAMVRIAQFHTVLNSGVGEQAAAECVPADRKKE